MIVFIHDSEFDLLDAGNLTCLHSLSYASFTNHYSFKFWAVLTQNQKESHCILGAFPGTLSSKHAILTIKKDRLYVIIMSLTRFRVNLNCIVA